MKSRPANTLAHNIADARINVSQGLLFPEIPREVCNRIGLNWWAAVKLHETGWLSFDPRIVATLEEDQEAELVFVGSLVAGGCDDTMLKQMLTGLAKPYRYRAHQIYFDWVAKTWRLLPVSKEPDAEAVFSDWLAELVDAGETSKIEELKEAILAAEAECKGVASPE